MQISHPQVSDPTDYKGFPFPSPEGDRATFLPFGDLYELIQAKKPTIAFMDDIGQAPPAVQAALMQLLLARRVNGHKISDEVTFIAATNRREDMAGVSGLLEPVKSRFAAILELEENLNDWCDWALENKIPEELVGFIRFRPELLCDFTPSRDLVNSPCPRTLDNAGRWLLCGAMEEAPLFSVLKGAAGERFATEFTAFLKIFRNLPEIDRIIENPRSTKVPGDASILHATCCALAKRAEKRNFDRILLFLTRIPAETKFGNELVFFTVHAAVTRNKALHKNPAFLAWCSKNGKEVL